mmetsp:Transcript_56549/g.127857  ORF Transcript_56549/g.127857 Transcript_56549/m.127857 type:complete len:596 (-) Transcript_56549:91-1878(-)
MALTSLALLPALWQGGMAAAQPDQLREAIRVSMRSEHGRRLSAPAMQEVVGRLGFSLQGVHVRSFDEDGTMVHTRYSVRPPVTPPERRLSTRWDSNRQFVRDMKNLAILSYTKLDPYTTDVLDPVIAAGDSVYGASIQSYAQEMTAETDAFDQILAAVNQIGTTSVSDAGLDINASGLTSTGVHALEFQGAGVGNVLVFRGSYSKGDFANIKPWIAAWINGKMNQQLKHQWIDISGLPWTTEMAAANAQMDAASRAAIAGGSWQGTFSLDDYLTIFAQSAVSKGFPSSRVSFVAETGYWEFTKLIAESARTVAITAGEAFYITGHSQGGARAALTSMYLEKQHGTKYTTTTFAAVGGTCFSRNIAYTSENMLSDVDPFVTHDQITEYVHALDIFGHFDIDPGTTCVYGTTNIASSKAKKYCEQVFGYNGPDLMVAGNFGGVGDFLGPSEALQHKLKRCLYFTHNTVSVDADIDNDVYLYEDGTTDGGCSMADTIPSSDPNERCPAALDTVTQEGCNDARSCGVCSVTTSSLLGVGCKWCQATQTCRSKSVSWFTSCASTWTTCKVASGARAGGMHTIIASVVVLTGATLVTGMYA